MGDPQPNQITTNFPIYGETTYLFRKRLTHTDMKNGLILTENATDYFESLPAYIQNLYDFRLGFRVVIITPGAVGNATVTRYNKLQRTLHLARVGWSDSQIGIAHVNGFSVGDEVDCWGVKNPEIQALTTLLIQKVDQQPNVRQEVEADEPVEEPYVVQQELEADEEPNLLQEPEADEETDAQQGAEAGGSNTGSY